MKTEIAIEAVTPEILRAGVESNETAKHLPSRFRLVDENLVDYSVCFWEGWENIAYISIDEVERYMKSDSGEGTVWTTPIEEGK